ncbi:Na(+)/H(+) antiporter subunit C [Cellulomonas shaoxiangyii]|uniref:Na(+)/H(+) antiporter subunit C n=1 Tax=Cellulomonas shaoxiangyii TaxID=2566013 RepID=A0A4P7SMH3_9CELL|nr:Na(+)/H(+) antiporter subunit C [Cellulomonas shaoxiangyii]QCB95480.1 Na(+)/H(+) antiporter subunit C [Cellulomonas shaoxiangyii]TGY86592.1 Na(+)/H(+) antiporter subunit C [Cellulomonas shaoxiangyii]
MSPNLVLVVTIAALFTAGVYLVLERSLTRVLLGVVLLGNGTNLLILVAGGAAGGPPLIGVTPEGEMSDPLPQALVLTAIVITLGLTAFLLAMAYRSWQLHRHDEVQDDVEDRRIARLAARDERAFADDDTESDGETLDQEAATTRDETDQGAPGTTAGTDHGAAQDGGARGDDGGRNHEVAR